MEKLFVINVPASQRVPADEAVTEAVARGQWGRVLEPEPSGPGNDWTDPNVGLAQLTVNTSLWDPASSHSGPYSSGLVAWQVCASLFILVMALVGNSIMAYVVVRMPYLRTVANLFTVNLALADLGATVLVLPLWAASAAASAGRRPESPPPLPAVLCQAVAFIAVLMLLAATATLACIALDRYLSICHPLRYPMHVTPTRVYCVIGYIWLHSVLLAGAPLVGWGRYDFQAHGAALCGPVWSGHADYAVSLLAIGLVMPYCVMLLAYWRIIKEARKQTKRIEQIQLHLVLPDDHCDTDPIVAGMAPVGGAEQHGNAAGRKMSLLGKLRERRHSLVHHRKYGTVTRNLKTLKTVFIIMGAFSVCWWPYVVVNIYRQGSSPPAAELVVTILVFASCAVNPYVFIGLTRDFRFAVRVLVTRCVDGLWGQAGGMARGQNNKRRASRPPASNNGNAAPASHVSFDSRMETTRDDNIQEASQRVLETERKDFPNIPATVAAHTGDMRGRPIATRVSLRPPSLQQLNLFEMEIPPPLVTSQPFGGPIFEGDFEEGDLFTGAYSPTTQTTYNPLAVNVQSPGGASVVSFRWQCPLVRGVPVIVIPTQVNISSP